MSDPPISRLRQVDTHRLIPARFSDPGRNVLADLAQSASDLTALDDLAGATDAQRHAETDLLPGIGLGELVFAVPHAHIVNAAFAHAHPLGGRFNAPDRGAWYAGFALETAQAEVGWHKSVELAEIDWPEESVVYDDYLADFGGDFHDLRDAAGFEACLDASSYVASQGLAERLLMAGSPGVIYPSVRHRGGTCLACFRPALVGNVRRSARYRFTWAGSPTPTVTLDRRFD